MSAPAELSSTEAGQRAADVMNALTIRLDDELFAVEAKRVREILDLVPITEVPNAPAFAAGLINVRGRVVPLTDLRVMFDMERREPDQDTRIVVMEVEIGGEPTIAGILADKVYDVTDIERASIEEAPKVGMRWRPEYIKGVGKRNGGFIIIPSMERIFDATNGQGGPTVATETTTHQ